MNHRLRAVRRWVATLCMCGSVVFGCLVGCGEPSAQDVKDPPRLGEPRKPRPQLLRSDTEMLSGFAAGLPVNRSVRVIVRFEDVVATDDQGRIRVPDDTATSKRNQARIRSAQDTFLDRLGRKEDKRVQRYRSIPYVALDLSREEVRRLVTWVETVSTPSPERPYRFTLSISRELSPSSTNATQVSSPLATPMDRLAWIRDDPVVVPVIAVIDNRINPDLPFLQGRLVGRDAISPGYGPGGTDEPTWTAPALGQSHGTQVACTAAAGDPWCKILALRADEGGRKIPIANVIDALDAIESYWAEQLQLPIAAVVISLGDASAYSAGTCGDSVDDARALVDAMVLLEARKIAVVVAAGNLRSMGGGLVFPACLTNAVSVSGTYVDTPEGVPDWCWSNEADLCAPGWGVKVLLTAGSSGSSMGPGTSISAPLVASAISRLRSLEPDAPAGLIVEALKTSGDPIVLYEVSVPEVRLVPALEKLRALMQH